MRKNKHPEVYQIQNRQLTRQLDTLKCKLEFDKLKSKKEEKTTKNLIAELEKIKKEWTAALEDLHDKQDEYKLLIDHLKEIRKALVYGESKLPWYKKRFQKKPKTT